jgi:putative MATE family efflux protein
MSKERLDNQMFSGSYLRKLIIPLIIEQTLSLTVGLIDTIMVAYAGESAMSGVSLVETIAILLIALFASLAAGGAIVAGQYLGAKRVEKARESATQLVYITFIISLVIMAVCLLLNKQILSLVFGRIEPEVMSSARAYFYVNALSYPFIALFNAAAALFRGMGDSRTPMLNALILNVLNIIGNVIFIYGMGWGAFGTGLSSLISRIVTALVMIIMLRKPVLDICVRSYKFWRFDGRMIKRILGIGIPSSLENSIFHLGKIVLTGLVATMGTASIAANGVAGSIAGIQVIPGFAIGFALTTVTALCIGAEETEQARFYFKKLLKIAFLTLIVFNLLILVLLKPLLGLYHLSEETYGLAFYLVIIHGICAMIIWPFSFVVPNTFRAAGDVKYPMVIAIISMIAFRVGFSYLFAFTTSLGVYSVWLAMPIDWTFRGICFMWRYLSGKWERGRIDQ